MNLHAFSSKSCSSVPSSTAPVMTVCEDNSTDARQHSNSPDYKRQCIRPIASATWKYKKWEKDFPWVEYDDNYQGAFCKVCQNSVPIRTQSSQGSSGVWVTKPFQNWKKAVEKMRTHERSDNHKKQIEVESIVSTGGTVIHHFRWIGYSDKSKNWNALKKIISSALGCYKNNFLMLHFSVWWQMNVQILLLKSYLFTVAG